MVVFQKPNLPLITSIVSGCIKLVASGPLYDMASFVFLVSLGVWAYLEIVSGVNMFRRVLGIVVMIFLVLYIINSIR